MKTNRSLATVLLAFFVSASGQLWKGDVCETAGKKGTCVLLKDCRSAVDSLKKGLTPSNCGFDGDEPIVCCHEYRIGQRAAENCRRYSSDIKPKKLAPGEFGISVVGGTDVPNGVYPHMVALGYGTKNEKSWQCGGTLISDRFILTAAHCMSSNLGEVRHARLGDSELDGSSGTSQDYEILRRIPHSGYKPPSTYHDIALLELTTPVVRSTTIRPACLHLNSSTPEDLTATGWGLTQFAGSPSNILQEVDLQPYSLEECNKIYKPSTRRLLQGIRNDLQVCAGGRDEEKDTCQGDSGGPLQTKRPFEPYRIVGVTSFGKNCGVVNVPGVYTRVASYVKWIEDNVWS